MDMYLQFGHGMMGHTRELIGSWGGGTVVLSPRDLKPDQLSRFASEVTGLSGGRVLLDPQCYLPDSDHARLCSHNYWPEDYASGAFWTGGELTDLLSGLLELNNSVGAEALILPGMYGQDVGRDWLATQATIQEASESLDTSLPVYVTIALSADALRTDEQVGALLEDAQSHPADGYYLVLEHPGGDYFADDPSWLASVLDIVAGLRLLDSKVVLGYCNQQMLVAAAANATAICSGTWMNVRSFTPDKFDVSEEAEMRRRAKWYYCPQSFSEYKEQFLDFAFRNGVLDDMAPPAAYDGSYVGNLFSGTQPSTVGFTEQSAFRHYLYALFHQSRDAGAASFDETVALHGTLLDQAESLMETLAEQGVRGQQRDFSEIIDVNRGALASLVNTRGPMLRREWT